MKQLKYAALVFVSLFILVLAGCNTATPPTPSPMPTPTPTPVPTPTPTPTPTPDDVPYTGNWGWVVVFEDDTSVGGVLTITQAESEPVIFTESGEGAFYLCDETSCPSEATGLTVIGQAPTDNGSNLATAFFIEGLEGAKLIAADADNQLGTEIEGYESFVGSGVWANDDGSQLNVGVGLFRLPEGAAMGTTRVQAARVAEAASTLSTAKKVIDGSQLRK